MAFDNFLQLPAEAEDTQVVIIGIDENDIKAGTTQFQTEIWQNAQNSPEQAKGNWSRYV